MIKVVNKKTYQSQNNIPNIYIGRPSILGNPFEMNSENERQHVINLYKRELLDRVRWNNNDTIQELLRIHNLNKNYGEVHLVCWCAPLPCHGDIIKWLLERETTADTPNRQYDKNIIEKTIGIKEKGDRKTRIYNQSGLLLLQGYSRVVYGDHGPYIEFTKKNIIEKSWNPLKLRGEKAYYDERYSIDGKNYMYWQKKPVTYLPNPPKTGSSYYFNNRTYEGYADYRVGRGYISTYSICI